MIGSSDARSAAADQAPVDLDRISLGETCFWARPDEEREAILRAFRRDAPVAFQAEPAGVEVPAGPGYWSVTRYEHVRAVSRQPALFSSASGTTIRDLPPLLNELYGSIINMDDPRHARLRALVHTGFTSRELSRVEECVRRCARQIVARVAPLGECDFVSEIAGALPLEIICEMMGIPPSDRRRVSELSNTILGAGDPELVGSFQDIFSAGLELFQYAQDLGKERLARPQDDLTSAMMHAELDGARLTAQELGSFFILLVVAGNETTRNAISHGMLALTENPAERRTWLADFDRVTPGAVEEIVRWSTPVRHFRRTATADTFLGDAAIRAGDKVALWYTSANRDEAQFRDPYRFDVLRAPNDHLGYGGGGPHFCLGANLARREIRVMFDELLHGLPDLVISGPPVYLRSVFVNGIKRMPCTFTPCTIPID